jgi:aspartate 1-decarboxylase
VGSITIERDLMDAADILPYQQVQAVNNNGARFETCCREGTRGSGVICLSGAAARLAQPGDIPIVLLYIQVFEYHACGHLPRVALVDEHNRQATLGDAGRAS